MRSELQPGDVLGRYQLLVPIGEGGMGRVWVAREQGTGRAPRLLALKTALVERSSEESFWALLMDEARIASRIRHPNVCAIHALENEQGIIYLVMDWSDGGSLRHLLDASPGKRLPFPVAVRIAALCASGLHAAHELAGDDGAPLHVVHRDVSPQNILLSAAGQVKITDFGVAKARGQRHAPTETGALKGKLGYLAPEQVTTKDVDCRADIFALGCVLYEATVGERPFQGVDALATLYQLLEQPLVPPSERCADYPVGLERIVLKALERDPEARYQTARDMGRALEAWLASESVIVTDARVAELVRAALGERIDERARHIHTMIAELDGSEAQKNEAAVPGTPSKGVVVLPTRSAAPTSLASRLSVHSMIGVLAIGVGAGIALVRRPSSAPVPPVLPRVTAVPDTAAAMAAPVPTSSAAAEITITFRAVPSQAVLYVDDGPPLPNPFVAVGAPDGRARRVRAVAPGFVEQTQEIAFDETREVVITLHEAAGTNGHGTPRTTHTPPTPHTTPTAQASSPPSTPSVAPSAGKPPRVLDTENPFASRPGGS